MPHLDPTYLRYIYDNLIKGSVHPDNASELPDGLIGLYEEAFEEHIPVLQRQQLLQRFALFALLKKEVSAAFVAEVLGESEQEISEFINTYASWFNSPEPGKFQLYHERLKVYGLQKLSEKEIQMIHEKLIARLELAIEEQKADEFERYALEFLSEHLTVEAFGDESKGKKLLDFTKNETLWDRQIRISNKFDWSRKGLHQAALWTSKYDQEENIDCYLDLVQLHNKEQNDAENIVRLVANNDIDLALERITAFGGPSKEEKERQFILFMLCLMELTLLESKTQPWRKKAIEKLLKHLEQEIPVDHSLVNWGEFFSFQLMIKILEQIHLLDVDFSILLFRTEIHTLEIDLDCSENQLSVLLILTKYIDDDYYNRSESISKIAIKYSEIGLNKIAIKLTENIENKYWCFYTTICISEFLFNSNQKKDAIKLLNKAKIIVDEISNDFWKSKALIFLSAKLSLLKHNNQAKLILDDATFLILNLNSDSWKFELLIEVSKEYTKQGFHDIALNQINHISNIYHKCVFLISQYDECGHKELKEKIFNLLNKSNSDFITSDRENLLQQFATVLIKKQLINEINEIITIISDTYTRSLVLFRIVIDCCKKHDLDTAIEIIETISDNYFKCLSLIYYLEIILCKGNSVENQIVNSIILESNQIDAEHFRLEVYNKLAEVLIEYKQINFLLLFNPEIIDEYDKRQFYFDLISLYVKKNMYQIASNNLNRLLNFKGGIYKEFSYFQSEILKWISFKYTNKGFLNHSLLIANSISVKFYKNEILVQLIYENFRIGLIGCMDDIINDIEDSEDRLFTILFACDLCIKNKFNSINYLLDRAIEIISEITNEFERLKLFIQISRRFKNLNFKDKSVTILLEAKYLAKKIADNDLKNKAFELIALEFLGLDNNFNLEEIINSITNNTVLNSLKSEIVKLKINICQFDEAIKISRSITDDYLRLNSIISISKVIMYDNKNTANDLIQEVLNQTVSLKNDFIKNLILLEIISALIVLEKLDEALNITFLIDDYRQKNEALGIIVLAYHKIGNYQYALELLLTIEDATSKDNCRRAIINEMIKKSNFEKATEIAFKIEDIREKSRALSNISIGLLNCGFIEKSIDLSFKIPLIQKRHDTWIEIANLKYQYFIETSFEIILTKYSFSNIFIQFFLAKNINVKNISILSNENLRKILFYIKDFPQGLEEVFYQYSIHNIFFDQNFHEEKLQKYNHVLNLQWAIDLKKELDQIPN